MTSIWVQVNFYSYSHRIGQKFSFFLKYLLGVVEWVNSNPNFFLGESIICRYNIPVSWFHKAALSAPKETIRSARCSTVPATASERKEGTKMQSKINGTVCKLHLNKAVKGEKIKLPEKSKSFISQDILSDQNSTSGVKKCDVCNPLKWFRKKILHIWVYREGRSEKAHVKKC